MSGTKRMFEMTERIKELDFLGYAEPLIAETIGDEFNIVNYLAVSIVDGYFKNEIAKNFSWDGDKSYGS
jgi:hypothetical protein